MTTYTKEQLELKAHIEAENAAFVASCSPGSMQILPAADLDMWARMEVFTVDQYIRFSLECEISDMEKELYGIRLRTDLSNATVEQLKERLDDLYRYAQAERDELALEEQERKMKQARKEQERKDRVRKRNTEFAQSGNIMAQAFAKVKA